MKDAFQREWRGAQRGSMADGDVAIMEAEGPESGGIGAIIETILAAIGNDPMTRG